MYRYSNVLNRWSIRSSEYAILIYLLLPCLMIVVSHNTFILYISIIKLYLLLISVIFATLALVLSLCRSKVSFQTAPECTISFLCLFKVSRGAFWTSFLYHSLCSKRTKNRTRRSHVKGFVYIIPMIPERMLNLR